MSSADEKAQGPDLTKGIPTRSIEDGRSIVGRVGDDDVLVARVGDEIFAIGAHCTHYHGPLGEGLIVGDTLRCPWHHACFSLRTGDALRAPALDPVDCYAIVRDGDIVRVTGKIAAPEKPAARSGSAPPPESVVIIGGGVAGLAAAQMLRREGYEGPIAMLSADDSPPADRPNLSKEYLAGEAKEEWIPLRPDEFYTGQRIELQLGTRVTAIDPKARTIATGDGQTRNYGALLLATGADPVRLDVPGIDSATVRYLRSFSDSKAIVELAGAGRRAVVVGASFIGLEVAASLRARQVEVDVVAPDPVPLARVMGPEIGRMIRAVHEAQGVRFHLGQTVARLDGRKVTLSNGGTIDADFVVAGIGVRPVVDIAEQAGLAVDRGITVDEFLQTSAAGIFAAGDIARWPDPHTGQRIRVEHFVVAERQGQAAARNMLGRRQPYTDVPFFWSRHFDVTINYVGHAEKWDRIDIDGDLGKHDATARFVLGGRAIAVATISRDLENLKAEAELEQVRAS